MLSWTIPSYLALLLALQVVADPPPVYDVTQPTDQVPMEYSPDVEEQCVLLNATVLLIGSFILLERVSAFQRSVLYHQ